MVALAEAAPWANCAVDALAVPVMVGGRGTITLARATCGGPITIEVQASAVLLSAPTGVVVTYGSVLNRRARPTLQTCCPFINFFCADEHARRW